MPRHGAGVIIPPQLNSVIREVYEGGVDVEGIASDDVSSPVTTQEMVNAVQRRARTELASYMRVMCMRLGFL